MVAYDTGDETENAREFGEVRLHLHYIARSEIIRHRRGLASLSTEQRSAVEALLLSTVDKISGQVISGIQSYPEAVRMKCISVWDPLIAPS
ncbi:MAG: hypothetical protein ACREA9_02680 [Pyrinomonadaceae bacterium]